MYGIPNMKLEKHIIDRKIRIMEEEGVKFVTNTDIGKDAKSKKLLDGFDRVVLCLSLIHICFGSNTAFSFV